MTQIAIGVLDGARSTKTVLAVKNWAIDGKKKMKKFFKTNDPGASAIMKSNDWLIAAAKAKISIYRYRIASMRWPKRMLWPKLSVPIH